MSETEEWTIGRLLTWTTNYLKQKGGDRPRVDAEVLLAHACHCERINLYTRYEELVDEETRTTFRELIKRRGTGTPVAYLVGHKEFYSLSFRVTPDVLIPRPETEDLVVAAMDELKAIASRDVESQKPIRVVDVGTGSGAIAICIAKYGGPRCKVQAVDISPAALEVAKQNAAAHKLVAAIDFYEADLLTPFGDERQFHIIASNPPYVSESEFQALPPDVRDHEPRGALVSGEHGCDAIARLIPQAAAALLPDGLLLIEISPMIEARVHNLITANGGFQPPQTRKDLAGHARIVTARRKN